MDSITETEGLAGLRERHGWPPSPPDLSEDWFGWLCDSTADMLNSRLSPETLLVVELGSFLGFSSRAILLAAPNAHLICVDTWCGSPEHVATEAPAEWRGRIPRLYEGFLRNLWPWRDRVTPIRADSLDGLAEIQAAGLTPDLVYIDSEHSFAQVSRELYFVTVQWPSTSIVGDDYNNGAVRKAADDHATHLGRLIVSNVSAFCFPGMELKR